MKQQLALNARAHTRVKTREGVKLSRKAAVKTTGVESLCFATPEIHRVPRIVISLVNFKTEKEKKKFRHIFIYQPIILSEIILLSNKHFTIYS
jgi:hypothetical protein